MYVIMSCAIENSRFPIDYQNLPIYLVVVVLECAVTRYTFVVVAAGISFGSGGFSFAVSVSDDIKGILKSINKDAKSKKTYLKAMHQISDFIQIHSTLKQLSYDSHNSSF